MRDSVLKDVPKVPDTGLQTLDNTHDEETVVGDRTPDTGHRTIKNLSMSSVVPTTGHAGHAGHGSPTPDTGRQT